MNFRYCSHKLRVIVAGPKLASLELEAWKLANESAVAYETCTCHFGIQGHGGSGRFLALRRRTALRADASSVLSFAPSWQLLISKS